jgi:hydrogenase small subunit
MSRSALLEATVSTPPGVNRRTFLQFCAAVTATLALPEAMTGTVAHALSATVASGRRVPVVWLAFQDCTGDTESFLRSFDPSVTSLLFDVISLDYHESLMAPSGADAVARLDTVVGEGGFICIVEGSIPTAAGGAYCTIGGRTALSIAQEVCPRALVNVAAGTCSVDGGISAARPNPTRATGIQGAVPNAPNVINMPGCPVNGVNVVAALVHYLTLGSPPPVDSDGRPLFAYGREIHEEGNCERYQFYEADLFVRSWGDAGSRKGWCLKEMGCNGPDTRANCFQRNWNQVSWPIGAGAVCIGCTSPGFWDENTPFFSESGGGEGRAEGDEHEHEDDD